MANEDTVSQATISTDFSQKPLTIESLLPVSISWVYDQLPCVPQSLKATLTSNTKKSTSALDTPGGFPVEVIDKGTSMTGACF